MGYLENIASQTYKHPKAILINDGSTYSSDNIARYFYKKDTRFKLITQVNLGVADASEKILRLVQGKFVIHTYSDHLMAGRAIEYLYK